jgi:type II secretory pathway pseudopilin PulG
MKIRRKGNKFTRGGQDGYMLLTMMLFLTLLLIAATAAAPRIAFQLKRDREEELIHRGVEYSRAIRRFTKKTGRFPTRLEELEGADGLRYIRRLYKDPITGGDFQLLHMSDIRPSSGVTNLNPGHPKPNTTGGDSGDASPDPNSDSANSDSSTTQPSAAQPHNPRTANVASGPQVIFGVASPSRATTIREFNHKNHYNQWLFFYDPALDRGFPIKGPSTPFVPAAPATQPSSDGNGGQGTNPQR